MDRLVFRSRFAEQATNYDTGTGSFLFNQQRSEDRQTNRQPERALVHKLMLAMRSDCRCGLAREAGAPAVREHHFGDPQQARSLAITELLCVVYEQT